MPYDPSDVIFRASKKRDGGVIEAVMVANKQSYMKSATWTILHLTNGIIVRRERFVDLSKAENRWSEVKHELEGVA